MKVIDSHVNISENGDWFNTGLKASYQDICYRLDDSDIYKAVLISMPGVCSNAFYYKAKIDRDRFWIFGNIDFNDIKKSLEEVIDLNLDGIKIHPRFQKITICDLLKTEIFERINELSIPVMICGWQQSSSIPIDDLSPLHIDKIAKKFKNVPIILTHLGGYRFWDAYTVARSNSNVFLDCSYILNVFSDTSIVSDFFKLLPQIDQKILFGSDYPEVNIFEYKDKFIKSISHIDKLKQENILHRNISNLLK